MNKKAQSAIEYLLIIGGGTLVAIIVIAALLNAGQKAGQNIEQGIANNLCKNIPQNQCGIDSSNPKDPDGTGHCTPNDCSWQDNECTGIKTAQRTLGCAGGQNTTNTPCTNNNGNCKTTCTANETEITQGNPQCTPQKCCKTNPEPLTAEAGPNQTITQGTQTTLHGIATGGTPPYNYSWTPTENLTNPTTQNPTAQPNTTTTFTLTITDSSTPQQTAQDTTTITIQPTTETISITPTTGLASTGTRGGPFNPGNTQYSIANSGSTTVNWSASCTQNWISLSKTNGSLTAGQTDTIIVTINENANNLATGNYPATIEFRNTDNGTQIENRTINLTITETNAENIFYVDNQLSSNCTGNYSIANRNCSGSDGTAYSSLQAGITALSPGKTILVRGGQYLESVTIRTSGTQSQRITIKAFPGEQPVLDASVPVTNWVQCTQLACPDLTVQGITNPNLSNIYYAEINDNVTYDVGGSTSNSGFLVLYENNDFLQFSHQPNQTYPEMLQVEEFTPLVNEGGNWGQASYLVDSDYLTQPDDYWNGATIVVWSHNANNALITRKVADFISSEHKIVFDSPLDQTLGEGSSPDGYLLENHPMILDTPGEYYATQPSNGKIKTYLWPRNTGDLTNNIRVLDFKKNYGSIFCADTQYCNYLTIDGLKLTNSRTGFEMVKWNGSNNFTGLELKNCTIHAMTGDGIMLNYLSGGLIENCSISSMRTGGRGILGGVSDHLIVKNNQVDKVGSTGIYFGGTPNSEIIGNKVGLTGVHGNGITTYDGSSNELIAGNTITTNKVSITLNNVSNITIYDNLIYTEYPLGGGAPISNWGNSSGNIIVLNNTLLKGDVFNVYDSTNWTIINNLRECGFEGQTHSNNIYITPCSIPLTEGESKETNLNKLFVNPTANNYATAQGSPAINAGKDISSIITTLQSTYPDFNFYKDIQGNPRPLGTGWDIGAYEKP